MPEVLASEKPTKDCCVEWHVNVQKVYCDSRIFIDPEEVHVYDAFCPECGAKIKQEDVEEREELP